MRKPFNSTIVHLVMLYSGSSIAGGPLVLEGPNGNTPVNYQNSNISLDVENGDLGALSNTKANALVQQSLNLWNNINTSTVNLTLNKASINLDVNQGNYTTYMAADAGSAPNPNDMLNPLIYDNDGTITSAFFGQQSDNILGFAASSIAFGSSHFEEGFIVINGADFGYTDADYVLLFAHEIAHFFGLDHSQANINNQESSSGFPAFCSASSSSYPVMYPIACRNSDSLHSDDISAASALYPETNINDTLGVLEGLLTTDTGNILPGANIWVGNIVTGEIFSIVSDYLREGTGFYRLYLPAGNYTLHANSINPEFSRGSGVGPYSRTETDVSFIAPLPITSFTYQETAGSDTIITINVNQTLVVNFSSIDSTLAAPPKQAITPTSKGGGTVSLLSLLLVAVLLWIRRIGYKH